MTRRSGLILAWALSVGAMVGMSATGAKAQDAAIADVRCLAVGLYSAASEDAGQRTAGMMMTAYFLGRLDGRPADFDLKTHFDLKAHMIEEVKKLTTAQMQAEAARCSADMVTRAKAMDELAGVLTAQGGAPPAN